MKEREIKWPGMAGWETMVALWQDKQEENQRGHEGECQCHYAEFNQGGEGNINIAGRFFVIVQAAQGAFQMQRCDVLIINNMRGIIGVVQANAHALCQQEHGQQQKYNEAGTGSASHASQYKGGLDAATNKKTTPD